MKTYPKHQRVTFMPSTPLGDDGEYLTGSKKHIELSRRAATEGMVLLKNDGGMLPLRHGDKIALFGKAQFDTVKGGGGSGETHTAYTRTIFEGLAIKEDEGKIELFHPLSDYYREQTEALFQAEEAELGARIPGSIAEPPFPGEIADQARAFTDTALITISRYSRESYDRTGAPHDGDFYLSPEEEAMVRSVLERFPKVAVLLNTGGMMDVTWFRNDDRISGALLLWQGGIETGLACADLLVGDECPSGHLPDTFADRFASYPNAERFNESDEYVEYGEDIFVGYRFFETFADRKSHVMYPFGYGLSYTTFSFVPGRIIHGGTDFCLDVTVTNTGSCPGKAVAELYASAPQGVLGKPARILVAFGKTETLAPGGSVTLTLSFGEYQLSSYDDLGKVKPSAYVLERGNYRFYLGENVRDASLLPDEFIVPETKVVEQLSKKCAPTHLRERLTASGANEALPTDFTAEVTPYDKELATPWNKPPRESPFSAYSGIKENPEIKPVYFKELAEGKTPFETFFAQLSLEEKASLLEGQPNRGCANTYGFGNNPRLRIPDVMTADGPQGVRIKRECGVTTTALPVATLLASTFNERLMFELGEAVASEVAECNFGVWLAPAVNIHRNPLCGRNFEYYSEDPYLAGKLAAALVRGVQQHGIATSVKHFCCNNKETNRKQSDSRVSERALREIYLKPFEIVVKEADPWTVMSSYNLLNGKRTSENKELLTSILRGEWKFNGIVISDWHGNGIHPREVAAGNDIKMPAGSTELVVDAVKNGELSEEDLDRSARRVLKLLLKLA